MRADAHSLEILLATPPEKVCLLRLSAIGDTCHVVPLLRTLQDAWPRTRFSWVIGKVEAKLMSLIPEVELITVDKGAGLAAYSRLRTDMRRRGAFDLLMHLQLSLRASGAAALIPARVKLGFDKPRARELQWLFTNARIAPREREHKRIAGSVAMPLNHLGERLSELPTDRPLLVYCAGGYRSSIAASLLLRHGFTQVSEIAGGIAAWEAAHLPLETGGGA